MYVCVAEVPRPQPVTLAEEPGHYTLVWEQSADTPVDNYTLFWCQYTRDRPFQCEVTPVQIPSSLFPAQTRLVLSRSLPVAPFSFS